MDPFTIHIKHHDKSLTKMNFTIDSKTTWDRVLKIINNYNDDTYDIYIGFQRMKESDLVLSAVQNAQKFDSTIYAVSQKLSQK